MPDDSNGRYSLPAGYAGVTGQTILTSQHNPPLEDLATAMTNRLPRAGTAPMLANLPMGGFKIAGLGNGTANDDAATYGQLLAILPLGVPLDYLGNTAPAGWVFCFGQALSRTTYAALFAVLGTTYGAGDGSTTFNIPDFRGRVAAGKDDMGGTSANRLTGQSGGVNGDILGTTGGAETHELTTAQMPQHNHGATVTDPGHSHPSLQGGAPVDGDGSPGRLAPTAGNTGSSTTGISVTVLNNGGGQAHNNIQPTIIVNKIIRTGV